MNEQDLDLLVIDDFDAFVEGKSKGFSIEEGSYDNARVVGWSIVNAEFEGKERKLIHLLWQLKVDDAIYTIRGAGWTISSNDKSTFRKDVSKWFNKTDWGEVCELLVKGGILVKDKNGSSAKFDLDKFIGKYGKLLIKEQISKKGSKYSVIASISPAKNKNEFEYAEVPSFYVNGDEVVAYNLAEGVKIKQKDASAEATKVDESKPFASSDKKTAKAQKEESPEADDKDEDLPF